nr:RNA-directed DNA polymerase, eukaryota [Tanacetum cinerariifolium]
MEKGNKKKKIQFFILVIVIAPTFLIVLCCVYLLCKKKRNRQPSQSSGNELFLKVSYNELLKATDGFATQNLIGEGGLSSVYKGILDSDDKKFVAVKVLDLQNRGAHKSFLAECEAWRNIRHRNLLKIITSCSSVDFQRNDFKALVYDEDERFSSIFHQSYAREFNHFISSSGLLEVKMEGYSFTWSHSSASKINKLDRFLVLEGIFVTFPLFRQYVLIVTYLIIVLYSLMRFILIMVPPLFRVYHSWFKRDGFDALVENAWNSFTHNDSNWMIRFKKKLQDLKKIIRVWIRKSNASQVGAKKVILDDLVIIDKNLDKGMVSDELLAKRMDLSRKLHDLKQMELKDAAQKSRVNWAIEGDENLKFFHGVINKRRSQLAIRGIFVNGDWYTDPSMVKEAFLDHFTARFKQPSCGRLKLNMSFPNRLSSDQVGDLDKDISIDEIRKAVWDCGESKSPGPNGFTFEFFRRYWHFIGSDFCAAVNCFFDKGRFPRGSNSSFIALIPKVMDAKHILDGSFILNEVLAWCKRRRKQALVFKVDFAKAYDSIRWDFLLDVLLAFGFGPKWCQLNRGIFSSNMASILINGSPSSEFPIFSGLKQGSSSLSHLFYVPSSLGNGPLKILIIFSKFLTVYT